MDKLNDYQKRELKSRYDVEKFNSHNAHYLRGKKLIEFADDADDSDKRKIYELALEDFNNAIDLAAKELPKRVPVYLAERSKLHKNMGNVSEAAEDLANISQRDVQLKGNDKYFVSDVMDELGKIKEIRNALHQLFEEKRIDPVMYKLLNDLGDVTAKNTALIDICMKDVEKHDNSIAIQDAKQEINEARFELIHEQIKLCFGKLAEVTKCPEKAKQEEIEQLLLKHEKMNQEMNEEIKSLNAKKAERNELEPFTFKVDESISKNEKLYDYYNALYSKLHSKILEAVIICEDHIEIDSNSIGIQIVSQIIDTAIQVPVAGALSTLNAARKKYSIKKKSGNIATIAASPSARENLIKNLAVECTLRKKAIIEAITFEDQELKDWCQQGLVEKINAKINFDADGTLYQKNPQKCLGCIDALKIIWFLNQSLFKIGPDDCVLKQLIEIPINYKFKSVKRSGIRKIYNQIELVRTDLQDQSPPAAIIVLDEESQESDDESLL